MKTKLNTKGSMLIWVIMLGAILSSVFLVMAMRLRSSTEAQRETMEYLSAKNYLESLADYWTKTPAEKNLNAEITGKMTQNVPELTGLLDASQSLTKTLAAGDTICWSKGSETNNMIIDGELMDNIPAAEFTAGCAIDSAYLFSKTSLTGSHTLLSLSPVHYKIKATTTIPDDAWHITLTQKLSYGKSVTVTRTLP